MNKFLALICITLISALGQSCSGTITAQHRSAYVDQEKREIKTLSKRDIDELKNGKGWGLAKAAELNGYPGPVHLLDMKKEVELSEEQEKKVESLFQEMKKEAIPLGLKLIEHERELNQAFAKKTIDKKTMDVILVKIASVYTKLRSVHLSAHLKTAKILSGKQIDRYNELRGYGSVDPCKKVPEGHDPVMWKKHNNC